LPRVTGRDVGMKIGHACKLKDMLKADLSG
jgi:hypothetical protein